MIKNYIEYINEGSKINIDYQIDILGINKKHFIPYDISNKLINREPYDEDYHYVLLELYEKIMKKLLVGKYVKFMTIGKNGDYEKQGYVKSVKFNLRGNCYIKIENEKFWTRYLLYDTKHVRVYDKEPINTIRKEDPFGEEDWDD